MTGAGSPWDFKEAINRVLKKWYEERIQEETERNRTLKLLHDGLTRIKDLREAQNRKQLELDRIEMLEYICKPREELGESEFDEHGEPLCPEQMQEMPRKIELKEQIKEIQQ